MITAIVFVKADVARIPHAAEAIGDRESFSEVYSVTGQISLIALVGCPVALLLLLVSTCAFS